MQDARGETVRPIILEYAVIIWIRERVWILEPESRNLVGRGHVWWGRQWFPMQPFLKDVIGDTPVGCFDTSQPGEIFTKVGRLALEDFETVFC